MKTTYMAHNFVIISEQFWEQDFRSERLSIILKLHLMAILATVYLIEEDLYHMLKYIEVSK